MASLVVTSQPCCGDTGRVSVNVRSVTEYGATQGPLMDRHSALAMTKPIPCFIAGSKGYVWCADGAMRLRKEHRIMGCLVGSVAQFKNQNEVNYLPLELSADEVTLSVRQGWIELFPETSAPLRAAAKRAIAAASIAAAQATDSSSPKSTYDGRCEANAAWDAAYHAYYSQYDPGVGFVGRYLPLFRGGKRRLLTTQPQKQAGTEQSTQQKTHCSPLQQQQQQGPDGIVGQLKDGREQAGSNGDSVPGSQPSVDCSALGWTAAVASGGPYTLPLTEAEAAAMRAGAPAIVEAAADACSKCVAATSAARKSTYAGLAGVAEADVHVGGVADRVKEGQQDLGVEAELVDGGVRRAGWNYPNSDYERLRFDIFCHLHQQGFMMTGGIKFGSDMLAYPGDPSLYHAQFTVRPLLSGTPINPMLLKAAARGSHAARKHLLLAFYEEQNAEAQELPRRIRYMSLAPEAGFGSKA